MPKHSGVCVGCAERGCVPLPEQGGVSNHPPPTSHPPSLDHITHLPGVTSPPWIMAPTSQGSHHYPGSWYPPSRGHTTPPPILSHMSHHSGVIASTPGYITNLIGVILPATHPSCIIHLLKLISSIPGPISHHPPTHSTTHGHSTHLPTMPWHRSHTWTALPLGGHRMKPTPPHRCPHPGLTPSAQCRWAGPRGGRRRQRP